MDQKTKAEEYITENKETLIHILKHSNDDFIRSLCLAGLIEYGDEADVADVKKSLRQLKQANEVEP